RKPKGLRPEQVAARKGPQDLQGPFAGQARKRGAQRAVTASLNAVGAADRFDVDHHDSVSKQRGPNVLVVFPKVRIVRRSSGPFVDSCDGSCFDTFASGSDRLVVEYSLARLLELPNIDRGAPRVELVPRHREIQVAMDGREVDGHERDE